MNGLTQQKPKPTQEAARRAQEPPGSLIQRHGATIALALLIIGIGLVLYVVLR